MPVAVVSAEEAAARDAAAISAGTASFELMRRAGSAAAAEIRTRFAEEISDGVEIFTGAGNNGGDGWIVAMELASAGFPVRVEEVATAETTDAKTAREKALPLLKSREGKPAVVVDALLGTGAKGKPRKNIATAIGRINRAHDNGARVIALDLPSGLDATTGNCEDCVRADLTLTFGTVKRGQLLSRDPCGGIVLLDIGLGEHGSARGGDLQLLNWFWVSERIPKFPASSHKGTRKRLAIVAGGSGMAGAAILSAKAALRSGIGLVQVFVAEENVAALHAAVPAALVTNQLQDPENAEQLGKADTVVVGPGLGSSKASRAVVEWAVANSKAPLVLDADALNVFAGDVTGLEKLFRGRKAIITPHPAEMGRLAGIAPEEVLARRFDIGSEIAKKIGAAVLLKGVPTVVSPPEGQRYVSATGTPALATGGSGDLLSGIIGTLFAQTGDAAASGACAAWVHGRAAEICGSSRGITLEDILFALPAAWNNPPPAFDAPVLAELPAVR